MRQSGASRGGNRGVGGRLMSSSMSRGTLKSESLSSNPASAHYEESTAALNGLKALAVGFAQPNRALLASLGLGSSARRRVESLSPTTYCTFALLPSPKPLHFLHTPFPPRFPRPAFVTFLHRGFTLIIVFTLLKFLFSACQSSEAAPFLERHSVTPQQHIATCYYHVSHTARSVRR